MNQGGITDVPGIEVGHYTDEAHGTGCTAILCRAGAVGGVDVRGSAPGTRETDLLRPTNSVAKIDGVLLSGGSSFGLDAAGGMVRFLEEQGVGLDVGFATIPLVPAAIIFDLGVITGQVRPGQEEGYAATQGASTGPVPEGTVGAGTGATVGKLLGRERAIKGGLGTASLDLGDGLTVGAIMVVNAVGGVHDPDTGVVVAGPREDGGSGMLDSLELATTPRHRRLEGSQGTNTTIGVVATNGSITKEQANKLAAVAHDGIALAVRPAHTMSDGDTMFALATGTHDGPADIDRLCAAATVTVSRAIVRGVCEAKGLGGFPGVSEL